MQSLRENYTLTLLDLTGNMLTGVVGCPNFVVIQELLVSLEENPATMTELVLSNNGISNQWARLLANAMDTRSSIVC